jgi:predicted enzyme related to lactoylglutathione lyase
VHFELPAEDPERAARFYESVLGWKFEKWDGPTEYWLITTGDPATPGIDGGLMRAAAEFPARTPVNTVRVTSLDPTLESVVAAGGTIALPKHAIPGMGWLAYVTDMEGVLFGLMQPDPSAGV